jgi:hypothetical protein
MFNDQETLNRQFELFEQSHQAIRDFFLREDQLLGEERRKFEEWKRAQQAWLDQQQLELTARQSETKQYEDELTQMERDIQSRERQVQKQQQTFQANQRQIQLAQQQHAQQLQQNQLLLKQQADQLAAVQANQSQQQQQLASQEQQQALTEQQLEQQRLLQQAAKQELAQRAAQQTQQSQLLSQRAQQAQTASLANRQFPTALSQQPSLIGSAPPNPLQLMGTPTGPVHTYVQDREEPKSPVLRQALGSAKFVDPDFRPDNSSLFINAIPVNHELTHAASAQWARLSELLPGSTLFRGSDGGPSGADIIQGIVGDMWLLNAMAMVAVNPNIVLNLVVAQYPDVGMYEFRFWKGGKWITVVVDDYVPIVAQGQLIVAKSSDPQELWVTLLEKAYAKLHGSYQCLHGGNTGYALADFTGGAVESIAMNTESGRALMRCGGAQEKIRQAKAESWLCGVAFKRTGNLGLIPGRVYSVMDIQDNQSTMVRLRNPWGLTHNSDAQATFYLTIDQLEDNIAHLLVCRTYNFNYGEPWFMCADLDGYWSGQNCGGQISMSNPQYLVCSTEDCACYFFLSQYDVPYQRQDRDCDTNPAYRKSNKGPEPNPNLCCGSYVLQCDAGTRMNNPSGNVLVKDVVKYATFVYGRQVGGEFRLPPSRCMCIMPCQFLAGVEAPYQLYIYSTKPFTVRKTLGEGAEQSMPLFTIQFSTPPAGIQWDSSYRGKIVVERQTKGEALEEDDEKR